jgi:hypothetical protein
LAFGIVPLIDVRNLDLVEVEVSLHGALDSDVLLDGLCIEVEVEQLDLCVLLVNAPLGSFVLDRCLNLVRGVVVSCTLRQSSNRLK